MTRMAPDDNRISAADEEENTPGWLAIAAEFGEVVWDSTVFVAFVAFVIGLVVWAIAHSR